MRQRYRENLNYIKFYVNFGVIIEVKKYNEARIFLEICSTVVNDYTQQGSMFQIFATIFAHFATPINEVFLEPL